MASDSVAKAGAIVDRAGRTWTLDDLIAVMVQARNDDREALVTLETSFGPGQWWWPIVGGVVASHAEQYLVRASAPDEPGRLSARRILERTGAELAGPRPTPLIRLAARRAALCSLESDLAYRSAAAKIADREVPPEAIQRWLDRADARFRKALKCLADLQRLPLPTVQVNVGVRQVNVATGQLNLPGSSGEAPIETDRGTPGQVVVTGTAVPLPALASPTTVTDAQMHARSQGGREPADATTRELGERLASPSGMVGATLGTPDALLPSECPTLETSGTVPPGVSPSRRSAPPSRPSRAARPRVPPRRDRRGIDLRQAEPPGTSEPARVEGGTGMRDAFAAPAGGRRTTERRGRTRDPPPGSRGRAVALDSRQPTANRRSSQESGLMARTCGPSSWELTRHSSLLYDPPDGWVVQRGSPDRGSCSGVRT